MKFKVIGPEDDELLDVVQDVSAGGEGSEANPIDDEPEAA